MASYDNPRPTSQPVGSTELAVAKDNLITYDSVVNAASGTPITNRKGVAITPLIDIIDGAQSQVTTAINNMGWDLSLGAFAIGKEVTASNQVLQYDGGLYRTSEALPYTTDGATPSADSGEWIVVAEGELKAIARSLNVLDSQVIYSTDTVTVLDNVFYIYDASAQVTWGVPSLNGAGETITSVTGSALVTSGGSYQLSRASTKNTGVNVKDFGAIGDGVADDTAAIKAAWAIACTSINPSVLDNNGGFLYFPVGQYLVTENAFLNNGVPSTINMRFVAMRGDGMGVSTILWKPPIDGAYMYDQALTTRALVNLTMSHLSVIVDLPNPAWKAGGFNLVAVANQASQALSFNTVRFQNGYGSFLKCGGDVNASENKFVNCKFRNIEHLLDLAGNIESINHNIVNTDIELLHGSAFIADAGDAIHMFGGSVIFDSTLATPSSLVETVSGSGRAHSFTGVRMEMRSDNGYLYYNDNNTSILSYKFTSCTVVTAGAGETAWGASQISNRSQVVFDKCVFPEAPSNKFVFMDNTNPSSAYAGSGQAISSLVFKDCLTTGDQASIETYCDYSQLTIPEAQRAHIVTYEGCRGIQDGSDRPGLYGMGFSRNTVSLLAPYGYGFPYSDGSVHTQTGTYFKFVIPYGAYVSKIKMVRQATTGTGNYNYVVNIVDQAEYDTPSSGVIFATADGGGFNTEMDLEFLVNKRFNGLTDVERTLWVDVDPASAALGTTKAIKSDEGSIYAIIS